VRVFRLVDEAYADTAFTGEGARLFGGRWNSPGTPMIYTAESLSLAQLELLVHLEAEEALSRYWRYFVVEIAPSHVLEVEDFAGIADSPDFWTALDSTRSMGDRWAIERTSVALTVPSVVTPGERNVLLNPRHPDYASSVTLGPPQRLTFDGRLIRG
jgi:RES domain-containing protein